MFSIRVPATTANLGPGFDCLGLALALYNRVELRRADRWMISIEGEGAEQLERTQGNLVWRAACKLWQEVGLPAPQGVAVHLENRIPLGRGLGSSAAAIVGGLVAANTWAGSPLGHQRVLELATDMEGHPDNVAPALYGGLVASVVADGRAVSASLPLTAEIRLGVCIPEFVLATTVARQALPPAVSHHDAVFNVGRAVLMVAALTKNRPDLLDTACQDRLHQPYRTPLIPGLAEVSQAAMDAGALAAMISGAGPTILTMFKSHDDGQAIGEGMCAAFARAGVRAHFMVLEPDLNGAQFEEKDVSPAAK